MAKNQTKSYSKPSLKWVGVLLLIIVATFLLVKLAPGQKPTSLPTKETNLPTSTSDTSETNQKAIAAVLNLQEVKEFKQAVSDNGKSTFQIGMEGFGGEEVVVVFEFFPDHRTTFNRYRVKNGQISRYDVLEDKWVNVK